MVCFESRSASSATARVAQAQKRWCTLDADGRRIDGQHILAAAASPLAEPCGLGRCWRLNAVDFTQDHVPRWEVKLARAKRRKCRVIPQARILRQFSVTGWWRRQSRQTGLRRENSQVSGNLAGN